MAATQAIDVAPRKSAGFDHVGEATGASLSRSRPTYESFTNVSQNGCFESDRVIKSGYVEKRTKTKVCWRPLATADDQVTNPPNVELEKGISRFATENVIDI